MEPNHGIPFKQKGSLVNQHDLVSSLPSEDLNKPCQKISQPPTDDISDNYPVSLSIRSSNCSLTNENPISVQDDSTSIYSLPISVFDQRNSQTETDSSNPKWINPPSYNLSNICKGEEFSKSHGDDNFGDDLFPELLSNKTWAAHLSEESKTVEWPLTNELSDTMSIIPAPKTADHFFNSSSYTDQINALNSKAVLTNPENCDIISDSFPFVDQNTRTAIPSPKPCDNLTSSFLYSDVASSTNREVSLPAPNYYEYLSNSETLSNHEYSQHSIPMPKSLDFFNSFPSGDELCLSNGEMTIPSPKSYSSFDSSVPSAGKVCSSNSDVFPAKQFQKCSKELNSDLYEDQKIMYESKFSTLKCDLLTEYSEQNNPMSCSSDKCNCNLPSCSFFMSGTKLSENFCHKLPNLRDCNNESERHVACDNVFPNDYLDELIKLGSKDCDIYRNETDNLEDIFPNNSKKLNYSDNLTNFVNKGNYEPLHAFDLENHKLKPSTYTCIENPSLVDFKLTSTSQKSALELNDASMSKLDFDYSINQPNVGSSIFPSQTDLDQLCTKPFNYYNSESELSNVTPFLDHLDQLKVDSIDKLINNLTASERKSTNNSKTFDCFENEANSVKAANSLLCFYDQPNDYSASRFTTSLDSLVDSNFKTGTDITVNISDNISVDSYRSTSTNSINEMIAFKQDYISSVPGMFCNESKSKSLLECNRLIESSVDKPIFFSKPSTSIDSGVGFLLEDAISNASLDKSSTYSELELDIFTNISEKKSSKLVCLDKNVINADYQDEKSAALTKLLENNMSDFLVEDQQRIDNLIDQFLKM